MTTAKEALLAAGRIQAITRGRISKENHDWLAANTDKWDATPTRVPKPLKPPVVTASVPKPEPVGIVADIVYTYPESEFKAIRTDTNKEVGMREVCNTCRVSLVGHGCLTPTILGGIPVRIVTR